MVARKFAGFLALLLACLAVGKANGQSSVIISEFLAHNTTGKTDEDGDTSDWIEIYNSGATSVNLGGWFLTDDAANLTKWAFPSTNLTAKGFLVVFASGKNRTVAGLPLHTSFSLSSDGEYLALVMPDGTTIATEFNPYPQQYANISYGQAQIVTTTFFVTNKSPARVSVPTSPFSGAWTNVNFDDSSWLRGTNGIGYETSVPGFAVRNYKANTPVQTIADAESVIATPSKQTAVYSENASVVNYLNTGSSGNYGNDNTVPGFTINVDQDEYVIEAIATITIPAAGSYTFGVNSDDGFNLNVGGQTVVCDCLRGPTDTLGTLTFTTPGDYPLRLVFFEHGGGSEVELFAASGSFGAWNAVNFHLVGDTVSGGLAVRSIPVSSGYNLSYRSLINTDVQSLMLSNNATALIRIPFVVGDTSVLSSLTLQMKYDDGFIAYLNGTQIASRNAPGVPLWNSTATASHPNNLAIVFEDINLTEQLNLLRNGANVLAIQGLNDSSTGVDFLIAAQLAEYKVTGATNEYLNPPTPGSPNGQGFIAFVADTKFDHDRGFYDTNFTLSITTATPGATIIYTTNGSVPSLTNGIVYSDSIFINGTTTIRAAGFKNGYASSSPDTQSYIFVSDVIHQTEGVKPGPGWPDPRPRGTGSQSYDFGMDQTVINRADVSPTILNDLKSLPTYSIVMDLKDMFDPTRGIYANPSGDTMAWERPASVELIYPDGTKGFQINAGIRIRGGYSRSPDNPKHGFRFFFRTDYGDATLKYPAAGPDGPSEFQKIDLRTFQNYSWSFDGSGLFIGLRDIFSRDTQLAMGQISSHGAIYHCYVNGQYWGLYNIDERPEANFGAFYSGGNADDYDTIKVNPDDGYVISNTDGNFDAWNRLWMQATNGFGTDANYFKVQGLNPDGTDNPAYENLIDVDSLIDYMLVIFWGGNLDAPISNFLGNTSPNNFFSARDRDPAFQALTHTNAFGQVTHGVGFRTVAHDSEHTLLDVNSDRTGPFPAGDPVTGGGFPKSNPQYFFQRMWGSTEFKIKMADHVQKHCFNGGVLTPTNALARFLVRSNEIYQGVNAEAARWGNANHSPSFLRNPDWLGTMSFVAGTFIPQRTAVLLTQLRNKGLFPSLAAPNFSQFGGAVPSGYSLSMTNTNATGSIYYTLDGSDPRKVGGAVSSTAFSYTSPVTINVHTFVRARVKDGANWSPLVEAHFFPQQDFTKLLLTEIMYHPLPFGTNSGDDMEFLELKNTGTATLDLSLLSFTNAINFTFTNGTSLAPGAFFVLGRNQAALTNRYPGLVVRGVYTKKLGNGGDTVTLLHPLGTSLFSVDYDDTAPWPIAPDGYGFSLVPVDPNNNPDLNNAANWRASSAVGGSPGADDPASTIPRILVNEILTVTDSLQGDAIELFNPTAGDVNIGGWFLTDDAAVPQKYRIPDGTMISAFGFRVFREADFNATPGTNNSFGLSSMGEEVYVVSGDANTNLTGYSHGFAFGPAATNVSFGRYVISTGEEQFPPQSALTLGATNAPPKVGPVVINEIMYHPDTGFDEFVELRNITASSVPLFDPQYPTNTWKLSGLGFDFPTNVSMGPYSFLLLVPIDPATFRTKYTVPGNVPIFGPYPGVLQNSGERLELKYPATPTTNSSGQPVLPYITVDEVRYNDKVPWPIAADGSGPSLQRWVSEAYGNDPTNWFAFGLSPGGTNRINLPPSVTVTNPPNGSTYNAPVSVTFGASASDPDGSVIRVEFYSDGVKIGEASTVPFTLTWTNAQTGTHAITARAIDNNFSATVSAPISITVNPAPLGTGTGLQGDYYQSTGGAGTFSTLKLSRVDPTIPFDWGTGSPDPSVPADLFAVRWTGLVQPRLTDTYAFYTTSDDGVRLWVDNQLIIDNWTDHGPTENIGSIGLTAGQPYVIKMEYYENGGGAVAQLRWSATGLTKEIIPQTQLYPFTNTSLSISRQPQSTNVLKGRAASFSVAVTGFAPKTFQWYFNQTNLLGGATNISLSFAAVQLTNDGFYNVVVNDPNSTVTSAAARLGVFEGPGVVLPTNAVRTTITAGDSFTLSITTSGSIPMNYSWRRNFLGFTNFFLNSNVCTFTITNIQPASATALGTTNQYSVLLTNAANGVVSPPAQILTNIAFLKILNPPVITNQPLSVTTNAGAIVSFRVGAKGGSNQVNQWYFNSSRLTSATNTTLNLTNVQPANQGRYFATITNVDGMATSAVALLLIDTADFDGDGMSNANEIAAGTDPTDPNSYLRIDGFGLSNGIILQFFAVTNRSYGIDYRTDIGSGGSWSRLVDFPANSNANRTVSYTNAPLTTNQFYRLTTQKVQ